MSFEEKEIEIKGVWNFLHHMVSGIIIFLEGLLLLIFNENLFFSLMFILIGAFLFIDDLLAETIDVSIFNNIHSNPKKLKIAGLLFFVIMEVIFILILIF
ncbi:MAG: hypothetical protein GF317_06310 [Candidatus Lokiarchaeota archaeon]|nr:hypothetical protein [Candidatus Lokiarchaeota archaeon]MBD3199335.1 hypothetical protein [Candidatus Lokiarchaeota archaeon]